MESVSRDAETQVWSSDLGTREIGLQVSLVELTSGHPPKYVGSIVLAKMIYSELQAPANLSWLPMNIINERN